MELRLIPPTRSTTLPGERANGSHADAAAAPATISLLSRAGNCLSLRYDPCKRRPALALGIKVALSQTPGVSSVEVSPLTARIRFEMNPDRVGLDEIETAIRAAEPIAEGQLVELTGNVGDECCPGGCDADCTDPCCAGDGATTNLDDCCSIGSAPDAEAEVRTYRRRLIVGGTGVVGLLAGTLFLGPAAMASPIFMIPAAAATAFTGYRFLKSGLGGLTGRTTINTDALVTVATVASLALGEGLTALVVLWLLNIGELLQTLTLQRTRKAISDLLSIGDKEAWIVVDGVEVKVPLESIQVGDTVAVYADEKIPVDGVVLQGAGTVNEAPITGEAMPAFKNPGDGVYAGTVLELGSLRILAEHVGSDTAVGRLIQRVEQAHELRAPIETVAEGFSRRFVPISFALAGLVFLLTRDIRRALTMLVIACPCAAGLSTPTAMSASIGNGARRGILIKGGVHLEAAAKIDTIVLDKTGTLTTGKSVVARVESFDPNYAPDEVLRLAASAEIHSKHPLALAVLRYAEEQGVQVPEQTAFEALGGRGIRADVGEDRILVGNERLLREFGVPLRRGLPRALSRYRQQGETVVCVAINQKTIGVIGINDTIRAEAREGLDALGRAGVERIILCTGDSEESARIVARQLDLTDYRAEYLPEGKFQLITQLKEAGHRVGMVGDGINDAPALALADVGIAMGTAGSDVAIEAADISLAGDDIRGVATVLDLSRRALHTVKQNYALALGVNAVGLVVASAGALNPLLAAVVHNLSTVTVVLNSSRLTHYEPGSTRSLRSRQSMERLESAPAVVLPEVAEGCCTGVCSSDEVEPGLPTAEACCASAHAGNECCGEWCLTIEVAAATEVCCAAPAA